METAPTGTTSPAPSPLNGCEEELRKAYAFHARERGAAIGHSGLQEVAGRYRRWAMNTASEIEQLRQRRDQHWRSDSQQYATYTADIEARKRISAAYMLAVEVFGAEISQIEIRRDDAARSFETVKSYLIQQGLAGEGYF